MSQPSTQTAKTRMYLIAKQAQKQNQNMLFQIHNKNQAHIIFNRPKIMNAFSSDMYISYVELIEKANQMDDIKFIVIRGAGGNFSSGNDLNNFAKQDLADLDRTVIAKAMAQTLQRLTEAVMDSKKPIYALVQGRTVGFAFTQLALYDRVFATQNSYFMAPLVKIAQGPQMSSSYLFPKIFGQSLAQQLIIKGTPIKPQQLQKYNFLTCHKNIEQANKALQAHIAQIEKLDWMSYVNARRLMRLADREAILKANVLECENLVERWSNPELPNLMVQYMMNKREKSKL